jgi:hypothetical protein
VVEIGIVLGILVGIAAIARFANMSRLAGGRYPSGATVASG